MLDGLQPVFTQDIIHIHKLWVAGIGHSVVTDKNYVNYISEIPCSESFLEVLREFVNFAQRFLHKEQLEIYHR